MFKSKFIGQLAVSLAIMIFTFPNISAAEIKVYDNNNQYLGILLDMENEQGMTVFIPSIKASYFFTKVEMDNPESCAPYRQLIFESDDCSGTPYTYGPFPVVLDFNCQPFVGHYLPDLNSVKQFVPKSSLTGDYFTGNPTCSQLTGQTSTLFYGIKEIQLPFTTPIALPVRFDNVVNTSDFFVIPVKKK